MKEKSIVLNVMLGEPGDVLEKSRHCTVKKLSSGFVHVEYANHSQEQALLKLTLTALEPYTAFKAGHFGCDDDTILKANSAGIFENHFPVKPGKTLVIDELE